MAKQTAEQEQAIKISPLVSLTWRDILSTFVAGLVVGAVYFGAAYLLDTYIFGNVLCRAQADSECDMAPRYASIVASVLAGLIGVAILVKLRIYRPLLIVIATLISLWGLAAVLMNVSLLYAFMTSGALFGLSFAVFTWFIRIRAFFVALVAVTLLVVAIRLIIQL